MLIFIISQDYTGVDIRNFTTSWSDGLAFNALLHKFRPELFDYDSISRKLPHARLEHAFRMAEKNLGIDRLLDPEGEYCIINFYYIMKLLSLLN